MSASSRPEDGAAANTETKNLKDQQIAPGIPTDSNIVRAPQIFISHPPTRTQLTKPQENDKTATNRAQKTAPMPEQAGKSIDEQSLSGGGKAADATGGSGKGGNH